MRVEMDDKPTDGADSPVSVEFANSGWSAGVTSRRVAAAIAGVVVATAAVAGCTAFLARAEVRQPGLFGQLNCWSC